MPRTKCVTFNGQNISNGTWHLISVTLALSFSVLICSFFRRPGFDSRHYQKKVVGLERGPLSLVSTTEELLDRKVAALV
jgi:hypothetical protein